MNLNTESIKSDCTEIRRYYDLSIEAYDFLSSFTIEAVEETLQNIGKLRTLGNELEQQATSTFEQLAIREQINEERNQHRLDELQWRVDWSTTAESNNVPLEEVNEMKKEITLISGDKQKEFDDIIDEKTTQQKQLIEQIQLGERSYNKLIADKEDAITAISGLNESLNANTKELKEVLQVNSTRGAKLITLSLQQNFFENEKRNAISFGSIKQLAQLSMRTQDEINQMANDIETTNNKVVNLQEKNEQLKDDLITKQSEMQEIELQIESVNTQLVQIKQQSEEIANFIETKKNQQSVLLNQLMNQTSLLQKKYFQQNEENQLQHASEKVEETNLKIEVLEKEEQIYEEEYKKALQKRNEINQKLLTIQNASEKEDLEEEIAVYTKQYQKAFEHYSQTKNELVKEKQKLISFQNYESSVQSDQLQEQQKTIENQQNEQEQREQEIEYQTQQLENKLNKKKQEKKDKLDEIHQSNKEREDNNNNEEDDLLIIPTTSVKQEEVAEKPEIIFNPTISQESLEKLDKAQQIKQKNSLIEEVQKLMKNYEELINIKEQEIVEKEMQVTEKEESVTKNEEEISKASEKIKQDVQKCKSEKREIIKEAKEERESNRQKYAEQSAKQQIDQLNKELINEFKKQGQILQKKQIIEEKQKQVVEKQAQIDKKVEEIQKKIFKDLPVEKKSDKIKVDLSGMHSPSSVVTNTYLGNNEDFYSGSNNEIKVKGSNIPLAYPLQPRNYSIYRENQNEYEYKEKSHQNEESNLNYQEQNAIAQKEAIQEQKKELNEQQNKILKKEAEINQKEQNLKAKKKQIEQEINKLNEDIEHCGKVLNQEDVDSQEYKMCEWQSNDYEQKKKQLEEMKLDYENQQREFSQSKKNYENNFNSLIQLQTRNQKFLKKSNRLNDGLIYLLQSTSKLSQSLSNIFISVKENNS